MGSSSSVDSSVQEKKGEAQEQDVKKGEKSFKCININKHIYNNVSDHNTRIMNGGFTTGSCHYFPFWFLLYHSPY